MKTRESSFKGEKGLNVFCRVWEPEMETAKAVILLFHGYAEHAGRYAGLAEYLTGRGYILYAPDHRGHGRSEGKRAFIDDWEHIILDARNVLALSQVEQPGRRIFALGHSMGAPMAIRFALDYQEQLAGCVLSGPAVMAGASISGFTKAISRVLSVVAPTMGVQVLDSAWLSRDPAIQKDYDSDPLNYRGKVMARSAAEMLRMADWTMSHAAQLRIPTVCLHGGEDVLVDPAGSRYIWEHAACEDKTLHIFDGLYHEIFNEYQKERVYQVVGDWLEARS